jgi:hypothetical protein
MMATLRFIRAAKFFSTVAVIVLSVAIQTGAQDRDRDASTSAKHPAAVSGRVKTASGSPIVGAAVVIDSATPRSQAALLSPQCHPDCLKSCLTDSEGKFMIGGLDDAFLYKLIVAKAGYETKTVAKVDSRKGAISVTLGDPRFWSPRAMNRTLEGRLLDENGEPVAAAIVAPRGYMNADEGMHGPMDEIASISVSDRNGRFDICTSRHVDTLHIEVRAKGLVPQLFNDVPVGMLRIEDVRLSRGVTVKGRVLFERQPVEGAAIGLVWTKRVAGDFSGPWEALTGADGTFSIPSVSANQPIFIYGKMDSIKEKGSLKRIELTTGENGSVLDAHVLEIRQAHKIDGRITLSDGNALPANSKVNLARQGIWDGQSAELQPDGRFQFVGIPEELIALNPMIRATGPMIADLQYHLSDKNRSFDPSRQALRGKVDDDVTINILMEPGAPADLAVPDKATWDRLEASRLEGVADAAEAPSK